MAKASSERGTEVPAVPMWGSIPIPVLALTMCAFCIGTAEFVVMGLLPDIARDLSVSIPLAGQLVTAYAIGVVVGAPIFALATGRMRRKNVILLMVGIFIIGNFLSAISPSYFLLMASRVLAAFAHGTMFGVGAIVAASMVPANRQASAIGLMFLGLTLANILGVPLGTLVGQEFGWRATFGVITALGVIALIPVWTLVPDIELPPSKGFGHELSVLRRPPVLLAIATTVFTSASIFALFTYIVPILQDVTGFTPRDVTLILFMIGVGLTIGITFGGRFSDRGAMRAMISMLVVLVILLLLVPVVVATPVPMLIVLFLWAMAAFATVPGLQSRVVDKARDAPNLASTLNIAGFNLGNALGAALGGLVLDLGLGLTRVPFAGVLLALLALACAVIGTRGDRT